jgi:hypothetical protein
MAQRGVHCHKLVRETAEEMAHQVYDELMKRNDWYAEWRRQHPGMGPKGLEATFVHKTLSQYVELARAKLAEMLGNPSYSQLHEEIYEALQLDLTLVRGRETPKIILN